jgi:hypothetical protein
VPEKKIELGSTFAGDYGGNEHRSYNPNLWLEERVNDFYGSRQDNVCWIGGIRHRFNNKKNDWEIDDKRFEGENL